MRWRLALAGVTFVIFGVPLIAINLGALGMQAKVESALGLETSVPDPVADAGGVVLDLWGNFREGREIEALFVEDQFTRKRSITYTETVTIADVLEEGEEPPAPHLEELYILARAPQRALRNECPVILETIGRACAVSTAEVDETAESGVYRIEAVVGWLPDHPLGNTAIDGARELYRSRFEFPSRGGLTARPEAAPAAKRSLYLEVKRLCDTLRETLGNCVIGGLELKTRRPNDDGTVDFYVSGALYVVTPKGEKPEGVDLVGTYGAIYADNRSSTEQKMGLLAMLGGLFGGSEPTADRNSGDGPRIIRGGHQRYGGNDGRFIQARER